ncbi:hypothetical protein A6M27_02865 [Acidithiobacillus thiooxidans]|uniref:Uncharacterized protein n=1 Tax=Acidithiobacillus thiooxidans TaxID=930 RepID=A0A1C2J9N1_ACITH|nr:hypothetical protein A6P07_02780 [Acidithiobacillus thiooxidans]OCX77957.1 hypothetical protein A6O24_05700 [Acidithiobacillus thiooxidans]OCX84912.1 hypothetical protein A6O26_02905 [Acidithiobacillus thiooxidans]OCX89291.1 hypothetical protein A6M27_02865 [Acidithiobacillus thiooxidans]OFC49099.1 hypothetical protein BAE47_05970 [Acidithiobacillus thiooxidans]
MDQTINFALRNSRSKQRNTEAERHSRRAKREKALSTCKLLTGESKVRLTDKGISITRTVTFPPDSVRSQLLHTILDETVFNEQDGVWVFTGSMRGLALDGLSDGKKHDLSYLLECMADFVRLGILTRLLAKRGTPITYRVNVNADV